MEEKVGDHLMFQASSREPHKTFIVHSDEEEDSSDGDDSIHTSDIEFIDDDSDADLDPEQDYGYDTDGDGEFESDSCSEAATESWDETLSKHSSDDTSEIGSHRDKECDERLDLATAMQGLLISSGPVAQEKDHQILGWLKNQTKFMFGKGK